MNYTNQYHLPQWEKSDRVMMDDFNQMCRDLENGLAGDRDTASAHLQDLDAAALRLAYNHYCAVRTMDPVPAQAGLFYRDAGKEDVPGTISRDGARFMTLSNEEISAEEFFQNFTIVSELNVTKYKLSACAPFICEFSAPRAGVIDSLDMTASVSNVDDTTVRIRCSLKNQETGEIEWSKVQERQTSVPEYNFFIPMGPLYVDAPFCANRPYQLIIEVLDAIGNGSIHFTPTAKYSVVTFFDNFPSCSVSYTLNDVDERCGGAAIVRYRSDGAGGSVTLTWNGETLTPVAVRETPMENGAPMREILYEKLGRMPKSNQLSLSFQCNNYGTLWFYDWGAVLI